MRSDTGFLIFGICLVALIAATGSADRNLEIQERCIVVPDCVWIRGIVVSYDNADPACKVDGFIEQLAKDTDIPVLAYPQPMGRMYVWTGSSDDPVIRLRPREIDGILVAEPGEEEPKDE